MRRGFSIRLLLSALALTSIFLRSDLAAQTGISLSKSSDFSTEDRVFSRQDTLYMRISDPDVDYTNIDDADFKLSPHSDEETRRGVFTNHLDGTYSAKIALSELQSAHIFWELEVEISDHAGQEFRAQFDLTITADGTLPPPGIGEPIEIKGFISALSSTHIGVGELRFLVDGETVIEGRDGQRLILADLKAGLFVEVKAIVLADSSLRALRIKVEDDHEKPEVEVEGVITAKDSLSVTVSGVTFKVDTATEIKDRQDSAISLADLDIGNFVEVKGRFQNDGSLHAEKIKVEDADKGRFEFEFKGFVDAITDSSITVNGQTFFFDSLTVFLDRDQFLTVLGQIKPGMFVELKVKFRNDGKRRVLRVKIEDELGAKIEVKGVIEALSMTSLTVKGTVFVLDSTTVVLDRDRRLSDRSILQLGQLVEIKGRRLSDSTWVAVRIKLEDGVKDEIEVKGKIQALGVDNITVLGITFTVDSTTVLLDHRKQPATFADLQVGMVVEVKGQVITPGTAAARRIKMEDRANDEIEIKATIDSLQTDRMLAAGLWFTLSEKTIVLDRDRVRVGIAALTVGQFVEIKARRLPDSTLFAVRIKFEDRGTLAFKIRGSITAISGSTVFVEGVALLTDATTQFLGRDNAILLLTDFSVGDFVEAEAEVLVAGVPLLKKMKKEDWVSIRGQILSISGSTVTLATAQVVVDSTTFVSGAVNTALDATALAVGVPVLVRGTVSGSGEIVASTVVVGSSTVTSVQSDRSSTLPSDFLLEQNYPNPFNPETTLRYRIRAVQPQQVVLRIYNLLGQEVVTLVHALQPSGTYTVSWDGRDRFGRPMASGIYLSRLQVGRQAQVRRMVLSR